MELTIEQRLKRIEDRLGITDEDARKRLIKDMTLLCISYGLSSRDAKSISWAKANDGYSFDELEDWLIMRGGKSNG